jgi:hypothetical protein
MNEDAERQKDGREHELAGPLVLESSDSVRDGPERIFKKDFMYQTRRISAHSHLHEPTCCPFSAWLSITEYWME